MNDRVWGYVGYENSTAIRLLSRFVEVPFFFDVNTVGSCRREWRFPPMQGDKDE